MKSTSESNTRRSSLWALFFAIVGIGGIGVAQAWDGVITGQVTAVEITGGANYGFRVIVNGGTLMCGPSSSWSFLNESDSNYKTYVAAILMAKAMSAPVTIYTTREGDYCHIGYVSIQ